MAEVITNPKNVIPTVVYLRGNEVSRIPHEGTTKYNIATDEQIQSIINSFTPGGPGDVTYDVATDEQIQDIIDDWGPEPQPEQWDVATDEQIQDIIDDYPNENSDDEENPDEEEEGDEPEETNLEANENNGQEEYEDPEYVVASDDDIQGIIDDFDNNGHTEGHN